MTPFDIISYEQHHWWMSYVGHPKAKPMIIKSPVNVTYCTHKSCYAMVGSIPYGIAYGVMQYLMTYYMTMWYAF